MSNITMWFYIWLNCFLLNIEIIIVVRDIIIFNSTSIQHPLCHPCCYFCCVCCSGCGNVTDQCTYSLFTELVSLMSLYEFSSLLSYVVLHPQLWYWLIVVFGASKGAKMKSDLHQRGENIVRHVISIIFCLITNRALCRLGIRIPSARNRCWLKK